MKRWQTWLGFLISLLFLYLVFFKPHFHELFSGEMGVFEALFGRLRLDIRDVWKLASEVRPLPAITAVLMLIGSLFLRAWRWRVMISQLGTVSYNVVYHAVNIGYLLNNILPFRAGEFLRAVLVGQRSGLSKISMLSVLVLERVFDLAGLVVLFGIVLALYPFPEWVRIGGGIMAVVIFAVLIVGLFISKSHEKISSWIKVKTAERSDFLQSLGKHAINLFQGLHVLRKTSAMLNVVWSSLMLWLIYITIMKLSLDAFGLTNNPNNGIEGAGWLASAVLTVMTTLGLGIPSAPGAVGTYHGVAVLSLSWFGIEESTAVIFATYLHLFMMTTLSGMGLISVWRMGLKWKTLLQSARQIDNSKPE
ncbi:flippase-like domain-containing protein [bacterium]|nr:flippase-like domain-containing protein [bacterium]